MARIRSVKPEFWVDRSFVRKVPNRDARMLYMALWNLADEHARLMGDPAYIKGQAFPYAEDDDLTPKVIDELLDMLADAERVVRYEVDGDPYLFLPRLAKHQRLESAKVPSRLPPPPDPDDPAPRPDKSAPDPDGTAPIVDSLPDAESPQVSRPSDVRADLSARDSDESARGADSSALFYVAGCMEHVAGSRETTAPDALPPSDALGVDAADKPQPQTKESVSESGKPKTAKQSASDRGSRIPEDFALTDAMRDWGRKHCPHITDPEGATAEFVDYWLSEAGARARKLDWVLTWKNRMRALEKRAVERLPANRAAIPSQRPSTTTRIVDQGVDLIRKMAAEDGVDLGALISVDFSQRRELTA